MLFLSASSQNSQSPKAFLFDIRSRLYVATDASPVDSATHNLCCDYLLMLNSFGPLYRWAGFFCFQSLIAIGIHRSITASPERQRVLTGASTTSLLNDSFPSLLPQTDSYSNDVYPIKSSKEVITSSNSPVSPTTSSPSTPLPRYVNGNSFHHRGSAPRTPTQQSVVLQPRLFPISSQAASVPPPASAYSQPGPLSHSTSLKDYKGQLFYPSASTTLSAPISVSTGSTTLTYHLITKNLALLALIPTGVFEDRRGLVEYNVVFFREGVQEICDVEEEVRGVGEGGG